MKYFLPQYAARAIVDMERFADRIKDQQEYKYYCATLTVLAMMIRSATHIVLPDNGEIYRDTGRCGQGYVPTEDECESFMGIPAPVCCLQYAWTKPLEHDVEGSGGFDDAIGRLESAPKRITLLVDTKQIYPEHEPRVFLYSIFYSKADGHWLLSPMSIMLPQPLQVEQSEPSRGYWDWGFWAGYTDLVRGKTLDPAHDENFIKETAGEFRTDLTAAVQMCHALRAGAVLDERQEQSSSRRRKFERLGVGGFTYHVLRVPSHGEGRAAGGSHASPRLHVRRAHIRKLPTGALTFVRQCLVGDAAAGMVEKHYSLAGRPGHSPEPSVPSPSGRQAAGEPHGEA